MNKFDAIAEYAEHHDFAGELEDATWETDVASDPMVTTSVRLPKSLLDWLRGQAEAIHLRPSTLIRQWIEQQRDAGPDAEAEDLPARVSRLEQEVFRGKRAS